MKEQTQQEGNKPWFGGDLVSLQQETLMPLQALFQEVGNIIIQGCKIEEGVITAGFVGIYHADGYKVAKFDGVTPEQWPVFLLIEKTIENRKYGDDQVKPVSYTYKAKAVYAQPQVPYIRLNETNNTSYYLETILADAAKLSKANRFAEIQQFDKAVGVGKAADEGAMLDVNGLSKLMGVVLDSFASRSFVPGMTGDGASLDENGNMEVNSLLVRKDMTVFELIVQKLRSVGGMLIVSVANGSISAVEDLTGVYRVTLELGDNVSNPFVVNDLVKCQKFNGNVKYYWRKVVAVGATTIDLSKTDADGSGVPEPGDSLVQLGHATDVSRQNAIIIDATAMPKIDILEGITTFSLTNKVKSRLGDLSDFGITGMGLFTSKGKFTGSVSIGYENIENPPDLSVFAEKTYVEAVQGDLQNQIDGVVDSWFYNYTPSVANAPASDWTTTEIKQRHVGDTFTNTQPFVDNDTTPDAGKSWRWVNNSGVFSWTPIADSDAVKALLEASKAQDTADGKRRVFTAQPSAPYDAGDLWAKGTSIYKCDVAKVVGQAYSASDWSVTATDDTAVNNLQIGGRNYARNTRGIFEESGSQYRFWGDSLPVVSNAAGKTITISCEAMVTATAGNDVQLLLVAFDPSWSVINASVLSTANRTTWEKIETTFVVPEGYNGDILFQAYNYPNGNGGEVAMRYPKFEYGNKATDYTPAPEDVDAKIAEANYLKEALQGSTEISGGLTATNLLLLKDALGAITGGMSGLASDNTGFWTGGTYEQALSAIAKIILRKDGSGQLAGGKIKFDALGALMVGAFEIKNGNIVGYFDNQEKIRLHTGAIDTIAAMDSALWQDSGLNFELINKYIGVVYDHYQGGELTNLTCEFTVTKTVTISVATILKFISGGVSVAYSPSGASLTTLSEHFEITGVNTNIIPTVAGVEQAINAGTYTIKYKLHVESSSSDYLAHNVNVSNSNTRVEIQQGIGRTEIGKDGLLSYFGSNNFFHFSQQSGLQMRGATNMPGILATGSVTSGASHVNKWGAKTSGNSVTKGGTGVFIVPHSVGSMAFTAIATCTATGYYAAVTAKANGSITVTVKSYGGAASDQPFDYIISGAN